MPEATKFIIYDSVRLTGRIVNGSLKLETKASPPAEVVALAIESDSSPVRVELHDFSDANGTWEFVAIAPWRRGPSGAAYVYAELAYTEGPNFHPFEIEVRNTATGATQRPPKLPIRVKPVVEAPNRF